MKKSALVFIFSIAALVLAGCAAPDPEAEVCNELAILNTAIGASHLVGPASDILDIVQVQNSLYTTWSSFMSAAERLENPDPQRMATAQQANQQMEAIPVSTQMTSNAVATASIRTQAEIATNIYTEFAPICLAAGY